MMEARSKPTHWEKLSPSEFHQLQEYSSCKCIESLSIENCRARIMQLMHHVSLHADPIYMYIRHCHCCYAVGMYISDIVTVAVLLACTCTANVHNGCYAVGIYLYCKHCQWLLCCCHVRVLQTLSKVAMLLPCTCTVSVVAVLLPCICTANIVIVSMPLPCTCTANIVTVAMPLPCTCTANINCHGCYALNVMVAMLLPCTCLYSKRCHGCYTVAMYMYCKHGNGCYVVAMYGYSKHCNGCYADAMYMYCKHSQNVAMLFPCTCTANIVVVAKLSLPHCCISFSHSNFIQKIRETKRETEQHADPRMIAFM